MRAARGLAGQIGSLVIMGGAKVSDKIQVITALMEKADAFLIGGAMAFSFYTAQGHQTGNSLVEEAGVALDNTGRVAVDGNYRTTAAGIHAIGDLIPGPMLAHKASAQGEMVAEIIAGRRRHFMPAAIPAVCFTDPELVVARRSFLAQPDPLKWIAGAWRTFVTGTPLSEIRPAVDPVENRALVRLAQAEERSPRAAAPGAGELVIGGLLGRALPAALLNQGLARPARHQSRTRPSVVGDKTAVPPVPPPVTFTGIVKVVPPVGVATWSPLIEGVLPACPAIVTVSAATNL